MPVSQVAPLTATGASVGGQAGVAGEQVHAQTARCRALTQIEGSSTLCIITGAEPTEDAETSGSRSADITRICGKIRSSRDVFSFSALLTSQEAYQVAKMQGHLRVCWHPHQPRAFTAVCHFVSEACLGLQSVRENWSSYLLSTRGQEILRNSTFPLQRIDFSFLSQVNLQIGCTCPFRLGHTEERLLPEKSSAKASIPQTMSTIRLVWGLQTAVAQFWTQHSGQTFLHTLTSALGVSKTDHGFLEWKGLRCGGDGQALCSDTDMGVIFTCA